MSYPTPNATFEQPLVYEIRLEGHLGHDWTDWFDGLVLSLEDNGETVLTGPVVDQAALYGMLKKVRDLGMTLLSVIRIQPDYAKATNVNSQTTNHSEKGIYDECHAKDSRNV